MFRKLLPLAMLLASSPLAAAPTTSLSQDAKVFGKRESAWSVEISPSGSKVVMLMGGPAGSTVVKVFDLATGGSKAILGSKDSKESLDWCDFANEQKLICRYSGTARRRWDRKRPTRTRACASLMGASSIGCRRMAPPY